MRVVRADKVSKHPDKEVCTDPKAIAALPKNTQKAIKAGEVVLLAPKAREIPKPVKAKK